MSIKLRNLLLWSWNNTSEEQQQIFWGLLAWLAAVTDISLPVSDASDNPLDALELVGPFGRSCKIPLRTKKDNRQACSTWEELQESTSCNDGTKCSQR